MAIPTLYTKAQLADILGKNARSIDTLVSTKKIAYIKDGRFVKFTEAHIMEYINSRTVKAKKTA